MLDLIANNKGIEKITEAIADNEFDEDLIKESK